MVLKKNCNLIINSKFLYIDVLHNTSCNTNNHVILSLFEAIWFMRVKIPLSPGAPWGPEIPGEPGKPLSPFSPS